jgi:hypothetical protein
MSTVNHIANAAASLWFVGYSKRKPDALSLVGFSMKQYRRRGAAILFKMLANKSIVLQPCRYGSRQSHWKPCNNSLDRRVFKPVTRGSVFFFFCMKQSQGQGAAILCKVSAILITKQCVYGSYSVQYSTVSLLSTTYVAIEEAFIVSHTLLLGF